MLQPLISLWRHNARVTFYDPIVSHETVSEDFSGLTFGTPIGLRRNFFHIEEAVSYLSYWLAEPGALSELKWLLRKTGSSSSGFRGGFDQWLESLAASLQSGSVIVIEETARRQFLGRLVPPPKASALSSLSSLTSLAKLGTLPQPSKFLTNLSSLQIEGAQVLPKINTSLAQVKVSLTTISKFSINLSPAPSKVGDINTGMTASSTKAQSDISAL
jgi:hypothetical protein